MLDFGTYIAEGRGSGGANFSHIKYLLQGIEVEVSVSFVPGVDIIIDLYSTACRYSLSIRGARFTVNIEVVYPVRHCPCRCNSTTK